MRTSRETNYASPVPSRVQHGAGKKRKNKEQKKRKSE